MLNRDRSWGYFNQRVLHEASKGRNPLLERMLFLPMAMKNIEEFYKVRMPKIDKALKKEMKLMIDEMFAEQMQYYHEIKTELEAVGYRFDFEDAPFVRAYFDALMREVQLEKLQVKHLPNTAELCIINQTYMLVLPKTMPLYAKQGQHYVFIEDVMMHYIQEKLEEPLTSCLFIRYMKDESVPILEHVKDGEDILEEAEAELEEREGKAIVGIFCRAQDEKEVTKLFKDLDLYALESPLSLEFMNDLYQSSTVETDKYPPILPRVHPALTPEQFFESVKQKDYVLLHPYDEVATISKLIEAAAKDPTVVAIRQTIYRAQHIDSKNMAALLDACRNGKEVTVLMELKARFDEANNIAYAKRLEAAGANVIYGVKDLKVHGKTLLILRKEGQQLQGYVQLGTGNYNNSPYVDMSLFTSKEAFVKDVEQLFMYFNDPERKGEYLRLGVAPDTLTSVFMERIDQEITNAKQGKKAKIQAKVNRLTDEVMIHKLKEAAKANVEIELVVRGACCLKPSKHIKIYSLIGRIYEHNRVYTFYNDGNPLYYLSSADWMNRNLRERVELLFPIEDEKAKQSLHHYMNILLRDNVKLWEEQSDGTYTLRTNKQPPFIYQDYYIDHEF